jgi:hypothetical protein
MIIPYRVIIHPLTSVYNFVPTLLSYLHHLIITIMQKHNIAFRSISLWYVMFNSFVHPVYVISNIIFKYSCVPKWDITIYLLGKVSHTSDLNTISELKVFHPNQSLKSSPPLLCLVRSYGLY